MKILLLIDSLDLGGAETHVLTLANGLSKKGHKVVIASRGGRLLSSPDMCSFEHVRVNIGRGPFELLGAVKELKKLIKEYGFDIIHAHTRLWAFVAEPIAKRFCIRFVTTVHAKFSTKGFRKRLSRWGTSVIVVSEDLRDYVCSEYNVCPENTYFIENGIDTEKFKPCLLSKNKKEIVFLSRLDSDCSDGAFALLRIAPRIKEMFPYVRIRICGGGGEYQRLLELALPMDNVSVMGAVSCVEEIFVDACVFVGVSRAAMEAMACGVPTVLYGNEGYFGAVRSKDDLLRLSLGNFCCRGMKKGTDDDLYRDIAFCLSMSGPDRSRLFEMLTDHIVNNHSANMMVEKTIEVYKDAFVEEKGRGDVVLCGYYGYGNMGDNALLRASIALAKQKYPHWKISALTRSPKKDKCDFKIRCVRRYDPFAVASEIANARLLAFGGGTLLQENTSLHSLLYYCALIEFAYLCGTRVELWGNGIGGQRTSLGAWILRSALLKCDHLGLRDKVSMQLCAKIIPQKSVCYQADLAMSQSPCKESRTAYLKHRLRLSFKEPYVVVVASKTEEDRCRDVLIPYLVRLAGMGRRLVFVTMFPRADAKATRRLCGEVMGQILNNLSASDLVGFMSGADLVLGMRLHSLVFARAAGVDFVGFGSDAKIEAFCRENGGTYFADIEL